MDFVAKQKSFDCEIIWTSASNQLERNIIKMRRLAWSPCFLPSSSLKIVIFSRMPLAPYANGPLSATGPVQEMELDMEVDNSNAKKEEFKEELMELPQHFSHTEEKADPRSVDVAKIGVKYILPKSNKSCV